MSLHTIFLFSLLSLSVFSNPSTSKGIIKNSDGTHTILEPRMVRGSKKLPIHITSYLETCIASGFKKNLPGSSISSEEKAAEVFLLKRDGSYDKTEKNRYYLKSVICYNREDAIAPALTFDKKIKHRDGSITFINPRAEVAGIKSMPISSNGDQTCLMLGYDRFYASVDSTSDLQHQKSIIFAERSRDIYEAIVISEPTFKELTCYNNLEAFPIASSSKEIQNKDGSITILDPKYEFADEVKEYDSKDSLHQACRDFGYSNAFRSHYQEISSNNKVTKLVCMEEHQKNLFESVSMVQNLDGSTTIKTPRVYSGGISWPFDYQSHENENTFNEICNSFGFEMYLKDTAESIKAEQTREAFGSHGPDDRAIMDTDYILKELSCYNEGQLKDSVVISDLDK